MASPTKDPRTGIWYFRKRVPKELREAAGRDTVKWSLETHDRKEAQRKWPAALERWERLVAGWTRSLNVESITSQRAAEIAAMWAARIAAGEPLPLLGDGADSDLFEPLTLPEERTPDRMQTIWACVEKHAHEALEWAGITANPESLPVLVDRMLSPVAHAYLQADLRSIGVMGQARAVNPLTTAREALPPVPQELTKAAQAPASAGPTITTLYERWAAVAAVKPRTASDAKYHVDDLKGFLTHDDAARVTVEDIRNWRDELKARGLNNNTVNARFGAVRQVFVRAEADGLIVTNPAESKLRLPKMASAPRYPYSQDDARRILIASRGEARPSRRWSHWIMAFSGARVGEVLQLMGRDIRQDAGIWFMEVSPDDATATVKNDQKRRIPLHPALIAEGFVAYAQGCASDAPLFPDKKLDGHGKRGGRAWQVVGRWVREEVGITDKAKAPNHSWRHYFEDALRDAEVSSDVRDAIIGHAQKTTGRLYGVKGEALARLARAVEKVPSPLD